MHKKLKKILVLLLAVSLLLTAFTACSKTAEEKTTSDSTGTVATTSSTNKTSVETSAATALDDYNPVTITVDLDRSGLGDKIEQTFLQPPTRAVGLYDHLSDILLDLGLADNIVALARGAEESPRDFPERDTIETIWEGGRRDISREQLLSVNPDFLIGWDSDFSEDYYNKDFCQENGIAMYMPYLCSDSATLESLYKDYETLGKIFGVEDVAAERIATMKRTVESVRETIGEDAYENPVTIFNFDSAEDSPFTACQGMPGDIFKLAGGISIFDDIDKGWATVSWEQVVERNPQVIIVNEYSRGDAQEKIDFLYSNEALKDVAAVIDKRIYAVPLGDLEGSCGSADLVKQIATMLYPDLF